MREGGREGWRGGERVGERERVRKRKSENERIYQGIFFHYNKCMFCTAGKKAGRKESSVIGTKTGVQS